jgi:hypothetical protein
LFFAIFGVLLGASSGLAINVMKKSVIVGVIPFKISRVFLLSVLIYEQKGSIPRS